MIVTVDEVKAHLRIESDEEDDYLESLIRQAQSAAEDFIREPVSEYSPDAVRLACLLMISYVYENRDVPRLPITRCEELSITSFTRIAILTSCFKGGGLYCEVIKTLRAAPIQGC